MRVQTYSTLKEFQNDYDEGPDGLYPQKGSRLETRFKRAGNVELSELIWIIKKEIASLTAKVSKKVEDEIEFVPALNKWKVKVGSFAHSFIPHHTAWSNTVVDGYLYVGKASGKNAYDQVVDKITFRDRVWEESFTNRCLQSEKFILVEFGPGNVWNPKAENYLGPNLNLQTAILDFEMSVSKVPTPEEILNAQADAVPDVVIGVVKNILLKRFSKNDKTKIMLQEIMEKSNVHKPEDYLGLKLAFERAGWEVTFDDGAFVFGKPKVDVSATVRK